VPLLPLPSAVFCLLGSVCCLLTHSSATPAAGKRGSEVIETGVGHARNKQTGKQVGGWVGGWAGGRVGGANRLCLGGWVALQSHPVGVPTWMLHPTPQLAHCCSLPHCPARPLQVAAAALLERLLETVVDEEALLEPTAGKPDKKDKKWQVWAAACAAPRRACWVGHGMPAELRRLCAGLRAACWAV
jgi:hypothetical protein